MGNLPPLQTIGTQPEDVTARHDSIPAGPSIQCWNHSFPQTSLLPPIAQHLSSTVEVDVLIPDNHVEGTSLRIEYAGQWYEVPVPVECAPRGTLRVPLLVSQQQMR